MSTLVCFHAHPDDEVMTTGGLIARASAEGHRVVLVVATNGEHGESPDDLADRETLVKRRRAETDKSAAVLGIDRVVWLGYSDSGMTGWKENNDLGSFHRADVQIAGEQLATVLREESAAVLTIYDWHGNYGHPDHIKVHHVGVEAARRVPSVRLLESTMNRDAFTSMIAAAREAGVTMDTTDGKGEDFDPEAPADDGNPMGTPEAELTLAVDVSAFTQTKRDAIKCHRSQISDTSLFLEMPEEAFAAFFGTEWFIERDANPPMRLGWVF
ncbi:MAG: GlcNAc-PI de-N-acetylase [Actinobacteria bacterium]|nr:MAG: GlcNAc-PI de-N-acetylase [Actinomycetota bacterium]